jgi:hypothetical protein
MSAVPRALIVGASETAALLFLPKMQAAATREVIEKMVGLFHGHTATLISKRWRR